MSRYRLKLCVLHIVLSVYGAQSQAPCRCDRSNSTYLTTAPPLSSPTATVSVATDHSGTTTASAATGTAAAAGSSIASASTTLSPTVGGGFILLNTTNQLSKAFVSVALGGSTPGYTADLSSNLFTLPAAASEPRLSVDLLVGPSGGVCRSMPYLYQICISSNCTGCNLNQFTAAAATTLDGSSAYSQRIFYPTTIVTTTVCADRSAFQDYGNFRYIVFLPLGSPSSSQPFGFRVSLGGNFSLYSCSSRRRRGLMEETAGNSIESRDDGSGESIWQLARDRRAATVDCSCPVGLDPVYSRLRTAFIYWVYPLKPFNSKYSDDSSAEHSSLAIESYYLLMDAARNSSASIVSSVVVNFYGIEFRPADPGVKLSGRMTIRDDAFYSDDFLLGQLRSILPGYGMAVLYLSVNSMTVNNAAEQTALPGYAIALICLLSLAALSVMVIIVFWRLNLIKRIGESANRTVQYKVPSADTKDAAGGEGREHDADRVMLGLTIDGAVRMPSTAFLHGDAGMQVYNNYDQDAGASNHGAAYENVQPIAL